MRTLHRWLASLKTAVLLLTVLSGLSLIGTLIPQDREIHEYLTLFPRAGNLILALGFDDLYRSTPFIATLWLLALSTLICTVTRLTITRRRMFQRLERVGIAEIRSYPLVHDGRSGDGSVTPFDVSHLGSGWQHRDDQDGNSLFLRVHGRAALIGGLLIHVGLLIILAGGVWGNRVAVESAIRGREGELVPVPPRDSVAAARDGDRLRRAARRISQQNPADPRLPEISRQLEGFDAVWQQGMTSPAFKLRFNKLWIDLHEQNASDVPSMTRNWNTALTVIEDGREVASTVIRVNDPFTWKGFSFFQADWSKTYRAVKLEITPTASFAEVLAAQAKLARPAITASATTANASATVASAAALASPTTIPGSFPESAMGTHVVDGVIGVPFKPEWCPYSFVILAFYPDFKVMNGQFVSVSDELHNPAARIEAYDRDGKAIGRAWAFPSSMGEMAGHFSSLPFRFTAIDAEPAFESGLQVVWNPSVPLVWVGCVLMTLGLCLSFYVTYSEEWIVLKTDGRFTLAVTGNRPPITLQPLLDGLKRTTGISTDTPAPSPNDSSRNPA